MSRPGRWLVAVACVGLGLTLAFGVWMAGAGRLLVPNTIVALELAFTPAHAKAILDTWGEAGRAAAGWSLLFDLGFICGYVCLLAATCLLVTRARRSGQPRPVGEWLAIGVVAAGACDLIENAALWGVLRSPADPSGALTWLAGIAATIKFVLAAAAIVHVLLGAGRALARVTPLVQWFLSYPLLLATAALVIAVVWRAALVSLGIPDLFWDESGLVQFFAGAGVGALLAHLGVMAFLLDAQRATLRGKRYRGRWAARTAVKWIVPRLPALGEAPVLLAGYLLRSSLPLLVMALAGALFSPRGVAPWWLPLGGVSFFIAYSAGSVWLADSVLTGMLWAPGPVRRRISAIETGFRNLHRLAYSLVILHVTIYVGLAVLYRAFNRGVYVALAVCVLLAGIASAYGFLEHFLPGRTFALLFAFVVAFAALNSLGGHRLAGLDYYRRVPIRQWARLPADPLLQPMEHLEAWRAARGGGKPPLVVVAVDGGGIRAAVWATVVLDQLDRDIPGFPYSVRVVTGASGGMVGMASYVGSLQAPADPQRHRDVKGNALDAETLIQRVATDSLGTVARDLVFKDLPLPPFLHPYSDRGLALEEAWEQNTGILKQPFAGLAAGEAAGWRPSLIVSPFIIEDGRRLLISNLDLAALTTVPVEGPPGFPSLQAIEYFRMIEPHPGGIALSTAARLNASFPYVSPPVELPTYPPRRVLDAGYYDNHGVELAGTWIWVNRAWLRDNTSGVLLVQVADAHARLRRRDADENREDWWGAGLVDVTGPIQALRTSGSAAADYRNDQLVRILKDTFTPAGFFETVAFEPDDAATLPSGCEQARLGRWLGSESSPAIALSWHLTSCEVSRLKQGIRGGDPSQGSCRDRLRLQDWWNGRRPAPPSPVTMHCPPA